MTKTQNYNLNQWEPTDEIRVEDFNADNAAVDAALGEKCRITIGSYTITSTDQPFSVSVGFRPKAVLITQSVAEETASRTYQYSAMVLDGYPIKTSYGQILAQITDDGFSVQRHIYSGTGTAYYPRLAEIMTYVYVVFA